MSGPGKGRHANHRKAGEHYRWNRGRMVARDGYVKLRVGRTHPLADRNGYAYEHKLVAVAALGRSLSSDEVIHHRNGDKQDNRWENLEVMTRSAHNSEHLASRPRDARGRLLPVAGEVARTLDEFSAPQGGA